jgi:23S rRNA pseudouridine1911/1915/1917 synthase
MLLPKGAAPELIEAVRGFKRQALHAARLVFAHPVSGEPIENTAALPADMLALLSVLARDAATIKKS